MKMPKKAGVSDAIAKRRAAARTKTAKAKAKAPAKAAEPKAKDDEVAKRRAAARNKSSAKALQAIDEAAGESTFQVEYRIASMTKNKVRYDAVDPDDCKGMDRQYVSKDALGGVAKESDAPQSITITVELVS